jgi:hypothetical protein
MHDIWESAKLTSWHALQARDLLQHLWTGPISNAPVDIVQARWPRKLEGLLKRWTSLPLPCMHAGMQACSVEGHAGGEGQHAVSGGPMS